MSGQQPGLFDAPSASLSPIARAEAALVAQVEREFRGPSRLLQQFLEFHRANPHVLKVLAQLADRAKAGGRTSYGAKALYEDARWELAKLTTTASDGLKLNNNHTAYYARLLALWRPDLAPMFRQRKLGPQTQME